MNGLIDNVADRCGDFMIQLGRESSQIANSVDYRTWLVLSTLVVITGFYFLKGNR